VRLREPGGALVVEVGEGAPGDFLLEAGLGDDAIGVRALVHAQRNHLGDALGPLGRVEPGVAQIDEAPGGAGDWQGVRSNFARQIGRDQRAIGQRFGALVRGIGGGEAGGEGEGLEAGSRRVPRIVADAQP
jgi:hypothetical protein